MTRYNAVFKGGGAKGIAYAGALEVCESAGVEFAAVAGSSAGAITATLIACGYSSGEIVGMMPAALRAIGSPKLGAFAIARKSLLSSERLRIWVAELVADRVRPGWDRNNPVPDVTFAELASVSDIDLYIVTMDLATRQPLVLCSSLTPNMTVADAVIASSAIPVAFPATRVVIDGEVHRVVDGGTWANYPSFVFRDGDFRSFHGLPTSDLPTMGFVLDTAGTAVPPADRETRPATGPSFPTDRGSATDEFGTMGALVSARMVQVVGALAPLAFVVLAILSLVREGSDRFPFFSSLWSPLQDPSLLAAGLLVGVSIWLSLLAAFVAIRFGRELLDTGLVGASAAMGVGPSVPYWVRTHQDQRSHVVVRIAVPASLTTLQFTPSGSVIAAAIDAGRTAARDALSTAGVVPRTWTASPSALAGPSPSSMVEEAWRGLRRVGRWLASATLLVTITFLLPLGIQEIATGSPWRVTLGVIWLSLSGPGVAFLGLRLASTRARRIRENRPYPILDRAPRKLLMAVAVLSPFMAAAMAVGATLAPSAVAYERARTILAVVVDMDHATGLAAVTIPESATAADLLRGRAAEQGQPELEFIEPDISVVGEVQGSSLIPVRCPESANHCVILGGMSGSAEQSVVTLLVDDREEMTVVLGPSQNTPARFTVGLLTALEAVLFLALGRRAMLVSAWRGSRQSFAPSTP